MTVRTPKFPDDEMDPADMGGEAPCMAHLFEDEAIDGNMVDAPTLER